MFQVCQSWAAHSEADTPQLGRLVIIDQIISYEWLKLGVQAAAFPHTLKSQVCYEEKIP